MTNFELAQTMARLGVVTASALDAGGSSTMAFGGQLLSRPSDTGGERLVSEALLVIYYGVYAPATEPSFSPNGDGAGERQRLEYKIVKPSTVTATLTGPDGVARTIDSGERKPGLYKFAFAGGRTGPAPPSPKGASAGRSLPWTPRAPLDRRALLQPQQHARVHLRPAVPHDRRAEARRPAPDRLHAHPSCTGQRHDHVEDGAAAPRRAELQRPRRQVRRPLERQVPATGSPSSRARMSRASWPTNSVGRAELARSFRVRRR